MSEALSGSRAIRAVLSGTVQGVGLRDATRRRAVQLGALGWIRNTDDGAAVELHAEGPSTAVEALLAFLREEGPRGILVEDVAVQDVTIEGHEQFAVRGVPAGVFVVQEHRATSHHHFDLLLEVAGLMRSWALPRGPSLDPAVKRLAVQGPDHEVEPGSIEAPPTSGGGEAVAIWDRGHYEQGGRVAWPEALARGHAVFVLHGSKLRGGFALQRTRPGAAAQWLLIKRRDDCARPGSDIVAEQPTAIA